MSDFNRVKNLFDSLDIGGEYIDSRNILGTNFKIIRLTVGDDKVDGYPNFLTEFIFDGEGKFIEVSIGED